MSVKLSNTARAEQQRTVFAYKQFSSGLEDVLHHSSLDCAADFIERGHLARCQPPTERTKILSGLRHVLGTWNWHCTFCHAPVDGNLRHCLLPLCGDLSQRHQDGVDLWQQLSKQLAARALGQIVHAVFPCQQPQCKRTVRNQPNAELIARLLRFLLLPTPAEQRELDLRRRERHAAGRQLGMHLAQLARPVVAYAGGADEALLVAVRQTVDKCKFLQRCVVRCAPVQLPNRNLLCPKAPQRALACSDNGTWQQSPRICCKLGCNQHSVRDVTASWVLCNATAQQLLALAIQTASTV
mmetsp:Transcript_33106/g.98462  ORF Transcript_33106/g.98462 Transcript_33106/m.98462 type:complete len:297 (-) Transcript_33106:547-1437(-)